ncbi:hypothetical protein IU494_14120 [Nocardia terpenica]|uniref:hypothetical protein n=1 Tax=Nocardia terpenica TaxID=455432 RepID=UPI00189454C1|nr:hypothetical protein [Nocardia terpenica]MBF6061508.1 hypothetical protein [Nocardia terpenica]MBF6113267.1 hypothetical protein [Nocardia terpenica]MBF6119397.1 hypothetical protein [Nocardia terpenica]MBF6153045.1 hypothetical protein [Nocardia terpenica]
MWNVNSGVDWKRGIGGVALAGAVVAGVLSGAAGTAAADSGLPLTSEVGSAPVANDGCTFSSVGGSCSDPGPVGNAVIAFRAWLVSMGYGTGSSSLSAYFF